LRERGKKAAKEEDEKYIIRVMKSVKTELGKEKRGVLSLTDERRFIQTKEGEQEEGKGGGGAILRGIYLFNIVGTRQQGLMGERAGRTASAERPLFKFQEKSKKKRGYDQDL